MANGDQHISNPLAQTATFQRVFPDGTSGIISSGGGGGEDNCPLWDGHIIDATIPPV
jgi:hypothetical protein